MNYIYSGISTKYPFRDTFQEQIEENTREFIRSRYGKFRQLNKSRYFSDLRNLEDKALEDVTNGKSRLIWLEIKSEGKSIKVRARPDEIVDAFTDKGDYRIREGIVGPFLKTLDWANKNGLDIPKLDLQIYFWIGDKPSWEINNLPVFIPAAIPPNMKLPLFPDISYFFFQPEAKYKGKGINWDETKKLYMGKNDDLKNVVYFRGCDTTRWNSQIRGYIFKTLKKHMEGVDISLTDVCDDKTFVPLHKEGIGKKYLLDLPGKFPWSVRMKYLFLFEGETKIIKVNERWVASDGSWEDPDEPWIQWMDTFLPRSAYVDVMHTHTQITKADEGKKDVKSRVDTLNKNAREDTVENLAEVILNESSEEPKIGHEILSELSMGRIYQMIYRMILTFNSLYKV